MRNLKQNKLRLLLVSLLVVCASVTIVPRVVSAFTRHPSIPDDVEDKFPPNCSPQGQPGQTIHGVYPFPSFINSTDGTGLTQLFGTSYICDTAPYNSVSNIRLRIKRIVLSQGSGSLNIGNLPYDLNPANVSGTGHFANPDSVGAWLSGLSRNEYNCWDVFFTAYVPAHSPNETAEFSWPVCVYYRYDAPVDWGVCSIDNIFDLAGNPVTSLEQGQSFRAEFYVRNTGDYTWSLDPSYSRRYELQSTNPIDTTQWGLNTNRIIIPGTTMAPTQQRRFIRTFTVSSTMVPRSNVDFSYRILNRGTGAAVTLVGGTTCARKINITAKTGGGGGLSCGNFRTRLDNPDDNPEPGEAFTIIPGFFVNGAPYSDHSHRIRITNSGGLTIPGSPERDFVDSATGGLTVPDGGSGSAEYAGVTAPAAGGYTITYQLTGEPDVANCSGTVLVATKPYFRVYGGDVSAGIGFGEDCDLDRNRELSPDISAFNKGSNGGFAGAGTQLATYAVGKIAGFASAATRTSTPRPANGLSFSNEVGVGNSNGVDYGGEWEGGSCMPDYYGDPEVFVNGPKTISPAPDSATNISVSSTLASGTKRTIYVNGDVFIADNIAYPAYAANTLASMPFFRLIVRGNIYVGANVDRLEGIYIAQPTDLSDPEGGGGRFYSCAIRTSAIAFRPPAPNSAEFVSGCNRRLIVVGAVAAQSFRLLRTNGTLRAADPAHNQSNGNQAEVFLYTPEVWLGMPASDRSDNSITGLPPIL